MTEFIVADHILYAPIRRWLDSQSNVRVHSADRIDGNDDLGVRVYSTDHWNLIIIDPESFSMGKLSIKVREAVERSPILNVISKSAIQYFATGMEKTDPIFSAINQLSQVPVVVTQAPISRLSRDFDDHGNLTSFKYVPRSISFPQKMGEATTHYIRHGEIVDEATMSIPDGARSAAPPLFFHNSGLKLQKIARDGLTAKQNKDGDYERVAFDELMLRLPARAPHDHEIETLTTRFNLAASDIKEIWAKNMNAWDFVRERLSFVGVNYPTPATRQENSETFGQFAHLVLSNFFGFSYKIHAVVPVFRHVSIPLFARGGVTVPLGDNGIVESAQEIPDNYLDARIAKLLPQILATNMDKETIDLPDHKKLYEEAWDAENRSMAATNYHF